MAGQLSRSPLKLHIRRTLTSGYISDQRNLLEEQASLPPDYLKKERQLNIKITIFVDMPTELERSKIWTNEGQKSY